MAFVNLSTSYKGEIINQVHHVNKIMPSSVSNIFQFLHKSDKSKFDNINL
jgi:hypothetical protein